MRTFFAALLSLLIMAPVCNEKKSMTQVMMLSSKDFKHEGPIPSIHTCEGQDLQPELTWKNIPEKAQSLALIMDDPDAPHGIFVHWVTWNLDPKLDKLSSEKKNQHQGTNSAGNLGYKGPCPPSGKHRYFFRLYALDIKLKLDSSTTKEELLNAMKGHILGEAELMGTYQKSHS